MPFPRPRLRLRTCLLLVALAAMGLGGVRMYRQRAYCQQRAAFHERQRAFLTYFKQMEAPPSPWLPGEMNLLVTDAKGAPTLYPLTDGLAYHSRMKRKYERAAARPWLAVPPDPPEPRR